MSTDIHSPKLEWACQIPLSPKDFDGRRFKI